MTIQHLEAEMRAATNDQDFTVAQNKREAIRRYGEGRMDRATVEYALAKKANRRDAACAECAAWDGETE